MKKERKRLEGKTFLNHSSKRMRNLIKKLSKAMSFQKKHYLIVQPETRPNLEAKVGARVLLQGEFSEASTELEFVFEFNLQNPEFGADYGGA